MKILISPSKTQNKKIKNIKNSESNLFFLEKAKKLNSILFNTIEEKDFNSWLELKNQTLTNETVFDIKNYSNNNSYLAIEFYDGLQFKNICYKDLNEKEKKLLNDSLIIISGFYGMVFPNSYIKPYRLMLGSKIKLDNYKNLYDYWYEDFNNELLKINDDKLIINLASSEYSKLINTSIFKVINIDFKVLKSGKYVSLSTYSKQCRGAFINAFIKNNLDINKINELIILGFKYNHKISDQSNYIFTLENY